MKAAALLHLCAAALVLAAPGVAAAAEIPWVVKEHSRVRLVALGPAPDDPDAGLIGIQIRMQPGWETYWRSPGDAGVPPEFDFDDTENVDELYVDWPLPERKVQAGQTTYVYHDDVLLPVTVYPYERTTPVKVRLRITYAACREVCLLEEASLAMDVRLDRLDTALVPLFEQNRAKMPVLENRPDLTIERVNNTAEGPRRLLDVTARADVPWENPDVIIETEWGFVFKPAVVVPSMQGRRVTLRSEYTHPEGRTIKEGDEVLVTVFDKNRAIERRMQVVPPE
jgi:suppressor for copper-sensitivity B